MCCSLIFVFIFFTEIIIIDPVKIDMIDCGIDHEVEVATGEIEVETYGWLGILYYVYAGSDGENRAVTPVALIQDQFVIGSAADIGAIPKYDFRENARVLLGERWNNPGWRVRSYVYHPQYGQTLNTVALVQLQDRVPHTLLSPLCPPPEMIRNPEFFVVRFKGDYDDLRKEVIPVSHVPGQMCKDFYVAANLYAKKLRPPFVVCAVSLETEDVCVWDGGAMLVMRDVWGRWQLLGVGVRGPGCGAPARFLDMLSYYPWVHHSLDKFRRLTISRIHKQKYVIRSSPVTIQRYGDCYIDEKKKLAYREAIVLRTDNNQYQFLTYNLTIIQDLQLDCLTLELVNASAVSEMTIRHECPRDAYGPPCYRYKGTVFDISIYLMFSDKCIFDMQVWGKPAQETKLIDIMQWKWHEGTYYEDFKMTRVEYRGQTFMTLFGYEPLDFRIWVPNYDVWTTTAFDNASWSSTTPEPDRQGLNGTIEDNSPPQTTTKPTKKTMKTHRGRQKGPWWQQQGYPSVWVYPY